ncbi:tetratricopeptide repeat protein [Nocardia sp. NPDC101769]|uniref:tetratricopeptide repeat protein n=1 Tax=Nocardia sp. NPDC101769 TaxID=3364333 RepID=UPI003813F78F
MIVNTPESCWSSQPRATRRFNFDRNASTFDRSIVGIPNNLASTYQAMGNLGQAIELFERTLTDCERVLGDDHPMTTVVHGNLAVASAAACEGGR